MCFGIAYKMIVAKKKLKLKAKAIYFLVGCFSLASWPIFLGNAEDRLDQLIVSVFFFDLCSFTKKAFLLIALTTVGQPS